MITKTNRPHTATTASKKNQDHDDTQFSPFPMFNDPDAIKVIEGEFHTLFVSKEDRKLEEFNTFHNGQALTAIKELLPEHKKYTLYIEAFGHNKNQLHKIMNELRQSEEYDQLEIRIDSPGGYVSEGIMLYNSMRELFTGRTTTFLDSTGFSMGAVIFSLGDERVAYEESSLMYHNYSTGYFGKGDEIKSYIEFEDKHFNRFFTDKIVNKGFLNSDEFREMSIGKDFWFDAEEMARRGIATHVIVDGYKLDGPAFLEYKKQSAPISEWAVLKLTQINEVNQKKSEKDQKELAAEQKRLDRAMKLAEEILAKEDAEAEAKKLEKKSKKVDPVVEPAIEPKVELKPVTKSEIPDVK